MEEQAEEEPWYRRLWPFGRSKTEPAPAAAPEQAAAPAVMAPPGRAGAQGERPAFAYDSPSKVIRTTVIGDCVKTGFWDTDRWGTGCLSWCHARAGAGSRRCADPVRPV